MLWSWIQQFRPGSIAAANPAGSWNLLDPNWTIKISMFQYIPVGTVLQILVQPCTSMYLHIQFLVPSCTTLYLLVPPCTIKVQDSTYWYIPVCTNLGTSYVSTYWYVPFWGLSYRHVARSDMTVCQWDVPAHTGTYRPGLVPPYTRPGVQDSRWYWLLLW